MRLYLWGFYLNIYNKCFIVIPYILTVVAPFFLIVEIIITIKIYVLSNIFITLYLRIVLLG